MKTSIVGYPRIGSNRELKFWTEDYFKGKLSAEELKENSKRLRLTQWRKQQQSGIDFIPSGDFSYYDGVLDTAVLLGCVPARYRDLGLSELDTYFAMARGYQGAAGDVKALPMRKWFNTNYHYMVPEMADDTRVTLSGSTLLDAFLEAKASGILTKPVVIGPYTFLKLARFRGTKRPADFADAFVSAYRALFMRLAALGAQWVQIDEPALVTDMDADDLALFARLYSAILSEKGTLKVLLQTYFGDVRDVYQQLVALPVDGIGLDFVEGEQSAALMKEWGFPDDKILFAGVVNGKNIWRCDCAKTLEVLATIRQSAARVVLSTSCSLLHVPYTIAAETGLENVVKQRFAFADEKLTELTELAGLADDTKAIVPAMKHKTDRSGGQGNDPTVLDRVNSLRPTDFIRLPRRNQRAEIQHRKLGLPPLPTTTIGSFPQTPQVRENRTLFRSDKITKAQYDDALKAMIAQCVQTQETLGLDVLVHGEFERTDMVAYFSENLSGFLMNKQAWVQSYGTRCVKPPIIFGDIRRTAPITVAVSKYAQSLTQKPMKGMLTGPITILNWSFPREDISHREMATQLALAIRDEVLDLEKAGLPIIQIDEAALREKLPLRKADWHSRYLDWAIPVFRLTHSGVKPETQIHTHMCYSEFQDILADIDAMDADVISFEASRSSLAILSAIQASGFETAVGPGMYDIHSPRVPPQAEIEASIRSVLQVVPASKLWINPDCGLKTRGNSETFASLRNLVTAAKAIRKEL